MPIPIEAILDDIKIEFDTFMKVRFMRNEQAHREIMIELDKAIVKALSKNIDVY